MNAPRLSDRERDEMVLAYRQGEPVKSIASRFGVAVTYPSELARRRGITVRRERHIRTTQILFAPEAEHVDGYSVVKHGVRVSLPALSILGSGE